MKLSTFVLYTLISCALAEKNPLYEDEIYMEAIQFVHQCGPKEISLCLKENALRYIENLPSNLDLGAGFKVKQSTERLSRQYSPSELPEETIAREKAIDNVLLERIVDYLSSHILEFKVSPEDMENIQKSVEEGRKKKGKKNMMPMLLLFQLKAATLGALALKFIGLVAFKALLVAKIALTLASVIALKKLLEQKHHTSTYEVVAHPHFDEHNTLDRSFTGHSEQT